MKQSSKRTHQALWLGIIRWPQQPDERMHKAHFGAQWSIFIVLVSHGNLFIFLFTPSNFKQLLLVNAEMSSIVSDTLVEKAGYITKENSHKICYELTFLLYFPKWLEGQGWRIFVTTSYDIILSINVVWFHYLVKSDFA